MSWKALTFLKISAIISKAHAGQAEALKAIELRKGDRPKKKSKSNVSGTGSGGSLKTWLEQDWRQVNDPSKKCGE
jgi:hypothetical protein